MDRRTFLQRLGLLGLAGANAALGPGRTKVHLVGDSIAYLVGPHLGKLARSSNLAFKSTALAGSSILSWSYSHVKELHALHTDDPDLVMVMLGSNDAYMQKHVRKRLLTNVVKVLERFGGLDKVVWVGPTKLANAATGLLEVYRALGESGVRVLDARTVEVSMWDDKLHPDERGRRVLATWIAENTWGPE